MHVFRSENIWSTFSCVSLWVQIHCVGACVTSLFILLCSYPQAGAT